MLQFKSRATQMAPKNVLPFAPLLSAIPSSAVLSDAIFDTLFLPRKIQAINWSNENQVHNAIKLTSSLRNANQLVGVQQMLVRDEVRRVTHAIAIESDGLVHYVLSDNRIINRRIVSSGDVYRAHIALRKFDGMPIIAFIKKIGERSTLFLNNKEITSAEHLDFPYFVIQQPTIGYPATTPPTNAMLFYKNRVEDKIYCHRIDPMTLTADQVVELPFKNPLGGADADINFEKCVIRAQCLTDDGKLQSQVVSTTDFGKTFGQPEPIDLSAEGCDSEIPNTAPVTIDNTYNFHVPVLGKFGDQTLLIDVMPDDQLAVAAIQAIDGSSASHFRFPSMGTGASAGLREGFGDGNLDGSGIIATLASHGKLLVSNSQSGGYTYPSEALLNHEMPKVFGFRATECYTRGESPNTVSMDYAFVEADDEGRPVSSDLWVDTWDMPLPVPQVSADFDGLTLKITIQKSGWFFHGQTRFEINPANTFITKVTMNGFREVVLEFDDPSQVSGSKVAFETKNVFYYYGAELEI